MKYWTRITHNFDNETREWTFREGIPEQVETKSVLGIHALESGRWMSLREIRDENIRYYQDWQTECDIDPKEFDESVILEDLDKLEQMGLVKSKTYLMGKLQP